MIVTNVKIHCQEYKYYINCIHTVPQEVEQEFGVVHLLTGLNMKCNSRSGQKESQTLDLRCNRHHKLL